MFYHKIANGMYSHLFFPERIHINPFTDMSDFWGIDVKIEA